MQNIMNFISAECIAALNAAATSMCNNGKRFRAMRPDGHRAMGPYLREPVLHVGGETIEHWGEVAAAEYEVAGLENINYNEAIAERIDSLEAFIYDDKNLPQHAAEVCSHITDLDDMEMWGHPTTVSEATWVVNAMLLNDPCCTFEDEAIFAEAYLGVLLLDDGMYPEDEVGYCSGSAFFRFKTKEPHHAIFSDLTPQQRVQVYNNVFFRDAACKAV